MEFSNEEIKTIDESVNTEDQTEELDDEEIEEESEDEEENVLNANIDPVDIALKVAATAFAILGGFMMAKHITADPKEEPKKEPLIKFQSPIVFTRPLNSIFKKKEKTEPEKKSTDESETPKE